MNDSPIILFTIVVCFIIMITISIFNFMRIGNLKNASAELEISLKNEYESNAEKNVAEVLSNISLVKAEMSNNINTLKKKQLIVDTAQDTNNKTGVDKMTSNLSLIQSNIDNVIEPKLVDFDGNFKSLEGAIESNKSDIAAVGSSITQLNTDVGTGITHLSTQFNTQHDLLSDEIQKINDSQYNDSQFFSDKIRKLQASQGFKPNGMLCEKMPYFEPAYCTTAHIYRKYEGSETQFNGLYFPGNFKYSNAFLKKSAYKQAEEIEDYKALVGQHHAKCESAHKGKDTLVKSICKSGMNGDSDADIKGLCHKQYCTQANEAFCHLFTDSSVENMTVVSSNFLAMMRIMVFVLILIITSVYFNKRITKKI